MFTLAAQAAKQWSHWNPVTSSVNCTQCRQYTHVCQPCCSVMLKLRGKRSDDGESSFLWLESSLPAVQRTVWILILSLPLKRKYSINNLNCISTVTTMWPSHLVFTRVSLKSFRFIKHSFIKHLEGSHEWFSQSAAYNYNLCNMTWTWHHSYFTPCFTHASPPF